MAVSPYRNLVDSLLKIAECPVCFETIQIPFKICSEGHGICNRSTQKLEACPTCQGAFTQENVNLMKNLLEALPQFCSYADKGCKAIVQPQDDHETFCGYRPIACRSESCEATVPVMNLLDHYETEHPSDFMAKKTPLNLYHNTDKEVITFPVSLFGNLFWIVILNDDRYDYYEVFFLATPVGKLEKDIYVQVKFEHEMFGYSSTLKASVLDDCTEKIDPNNPGSYAPNATDYLRIPMNEMKNLEMEGKYYYTLSFFEKPK